MFISKIIGSWLSGGFRSRVTQNTKCQPRNEIAPHLGAVGRRVQAPVVQSTDTNTHICHVHDHEVFYQLAVGSAFVPRLRINCLITIRTMISSAITPRTKAN